MIFLYYKGTIQLPKNMVSYIKYRYDISLCIPHKQNITGTSPVNSKTMSEELNDSFSNIDVCIDPNIIPKTCKLNNVNRITIDHININSLRNKFDALTEISKNNIDILMISETKIDDSFPLDRFIIDGYASPFRIDRSTGGGIIIYVREDIPSKRLEDSPFPKEYEGMFIELNLRSNKWLFFDGYNNQRNMRVCLLN